MDLQNENIKFPYNVLCEPRIISTGRSIKIKPMYEKDYQLILKFYKDLITSKRAAREKLNIRNKNMDKKNIKKGGNNNNIIQIYSL